ncbi:DUF2840 domain-containing protein [Sphingomonas ursincola]|uniref:DUF2840 domain-containing protein n=1 Tax=Sphingomonas ursincola TaxID=56361 RepID=A0A7V8RCG8_9SPHN|nr:DUF2840 domain-containing protein [Sphingomonas ursincola]
MSREPPAIAEPGRSHAPALDLENAAYRADRLAHAEAADAPADEGHPDRLVCRSCEDSHIAEHCTCLNTSSASDAHSELALAVVEFSRHGRPFAMWMRFGKPHLTRFPTPGCLAECYAPGQIFGLAKSVSHSDGDAQSTFDVFEVGQPGDAVMAHPDVRPGARVLLSAKGWRTVSRVLALIDAIEALGIDPCCLAPAFWADIQSHLPPCRRHDPDAPTPTASPAVMARSQP